MSQVDATDTSGEGTGAGAPERVDPLADSLLTREDGGGSAENAGKGAGADADKGGEGDDGADKKQNGKNADPAALIPDKPEGYDIKFEEGMQVDEPLLKNFRAEAHALGINQGQAQKLADFYAKHVTEANKAAQDAQDAFLLNAKKGWEAEIMARPAFKQEVAEARRTLKAFGGPELEPLLQQSLLGSHPAFFDFVVKVGKALAEPEARGSHVSGGKDAPLYDRMWKN